jgi:hypothetical protein
VWDQSERVRTPVRYAELVAPLELLELDESDEPPMFGQFSLLGARSVPDELSGAVVVDPSELSGAVVVEPPSWTVVLDVDDDVSCAAASCAPPMPRTDANVIPASTGTVLSFMYRSPSVGRVEGSTDLLPAHFNARS